MDPSKEYQGARTKANTFMNRNWWWVVIVVAIAVFFIGRWGAKLFS